MIEQDQNSQQTERKFSRQKYASNCELSQLRERVLLRTPNYPRTPQNANSTLRVRLLLRTDLTFEEKISSHQRHSLSHAPLGSSYSYVNCLHKDPVKRSMKRRHCRTYEYVYTRIILLPRNVYIRMIHVNNYSTRERVYTLNNLQVDHRIQRIYTHIDTTVSV